jgi:hypothetical protein
MGTTTPSLLGINFAEQIIPWMLNSIGNATAQAYRTLWDMFMPLLLQHLLAISSILFLVLLYAAAIAFTTGRWAFLGSVLYNYLYFGVLFIIGLIWGPEVFANDYFKVVLALLYVVCFYLVGKILTKTGLKRW